MEEELEVAIVDGGTDRASKAEKAREQREQHCSNLRNRIDNLIRLKTCEDSVTLRRRQPSPVLWALSSEFSTPANRS